MMQPSGAAKPSRETRATNPIRVVHATLAKRIAGGAGVTYVVSLVDTDTSADPLATLPRLRPPPPAYRPALTW